MPNLRDCIEAALDTGKVSKEQADELQGRVDNYERLFKAQPDMTPERALSEAEKAAIKEQQFENMLRKRQAVLQASAIKKAVADAESHPSGAGTGVMSILTKDIGGRVGYENVDYLSKAILARYHAHFAEALNRFRTKNLGFTQDKQSLRDMVRVLHNETIDDDSIKPLAKAWSEVAEVARKDRNKVGGAIPKREDWGLPQYHDPALVGKVKLAEWRKFIDPLLNRGKMIDADGKPLSKASYDKMMDHSYDSIRTDGLIDLKPGSVGGKKLANRRREHRFFVFKDGDSWLKYHDEFGHADIYTTLTDHLSGMAHETALMKRLGPNPDLTYKHLRDVAAKEGYTTHNLGFLDSLSFLDSVYAVVSGKANAVDSAKFAMAMSAARNYIVSTKLGSAFLSAMSDTAFVRHRAAFNGLPSVRVFKRMLKQFNPNNKEDRMFAVKAQLTADAWIERGLAANRFTEVTGAGFSAKTADFTMRASLLSPWTESFRQAFGMELQGFIAENAGKQWKNLNKPMQRMLKRYGFDAAEWDTIRKVKPVKFKGVKFFSPENMAKTGDVDLATKVQQMILTETDYAVPTPDARSRAFKVYFAGDAKRGSIAREISESTFMFKSFPISVIATQLYHGALQSGMKNKMQYLGGITIATTVMGGVAIQMKEISRGKNPRDMTDTKFWLASYMQGGGAGIYGDLLYADANRFGGGPIQTLSGPMTDVVDDIWKYTWGNIQQGIKGKDMELGADAVDILRDYTPAGSLWYARLAYERAVLDQLEKAANPKANSKFRRIQRKRKKDYGQTFFWKPGEIAPDDLPDFQAAGGN